MDRCNSMFCPGPQKQVLWQMFRVEKHKNNYKMFYDIKLEFIMTKFMSAAAAPRKGSV